MSARWADRLAGAARRLAGAGVPDPARDARLLLAEAAGVPADRVTLILPEAPDPAADARFEAMIAERARRRPVSQILGRRAFWGRAFAVTGDVLDPRPETESLVALALEAPFATVLDLGTGSGAILLTLLAERPASRGTGTDISPAALDVARLNAARLGLSDRATLVGADWWQGIAGRFDLIVSNPPYIAADEMAALAPEVRDWEPGLALSPGGDGLDAYRAIAAGAAAHLEPGGRLLLEIGVTQGAAVAGLLRAAGLDAVALHPDMTERLRVVEARRGA